MQTRILSLCLKALDKTSLKANFMNNTLPKT